jgi:hypothetical protein
MHKKLKHIYETLRKLKTHNIKLSLSFEVKTKKQKQLIEYLRCYLKKS